MNLSIHVDGGARGNPGPAGIAVVLKNEDTGKPVHEAGYYIGRATNNVAEYSALIRSLELAQQYNAASVRIHSDSELMVKQITGEYRVKSPDLQELFERVQMLLLRFDTWQIKHVYREQNKKADQLVNMALDAKADVLITVDGKPGPNAQPAIIPPGTPNPAAGEAAPASAAGAYPSGQYPQWTVTVTSRPARAYPGGCEFGQSFSFGPSTPAGMCVFAAEAMFKESPVTDLKGQGGHVTIRCPQCGAMLRVEMKN